MARRIRTLTAERVRDLPEPCSACAMWELGERSRPECLPSDDRDTLEEWVETVRAEWGDCGKIAYENGEPLGFVKYAPGRFFPQVVSMPSGPPDHDAVLIACLHVSPDVREAGLGKVLLHAALRDLASRREKAVEAYASTLSVDREHTPLMTVEFLLRQGFTVARPHPVYPLLRLELKSLATWTESVETLLETLPIRRRVPARVPAPLANPSEGPAR